MTERLPLPDRPITKAREAFIEALKTTPTVEALNDDELDDLRQLACDLIEDATSLIELVTAEQLHRVPAEDLAPESGQS